jgi:hypothetical protein
MYEREGGREGRATSIGDRPSSTTRSPISHWILREPAAAVRFTANTALPGDGLEQPFYEHE